MGKTCPDTGTKKSKAIYSGLEIMTYLQLFSI